MARRRPPTTKKLPQDSNAPTAQAAEPKRRPGRPPVHDEAWTKVTVVLFDRQIAFLDRMAANISEADIDLTAATSEGDLKTTILARLGRYRLGPS